MQHQGLDDVRNAQSRAQEVVLKAWLGAAQLCSLGQGGLCDQSWQERSEYVTKVADDLLGDNLGTCGRLQDQTWMTDTKPKAGGADGA